MTNGPYDVVEKWLLEQMNDPNVMLRWRTECAKLLLEHRKYAPVRHDPVEVSLKITIPAIPELAITVEHEEVRPIGQVKRLLLQ